MGVDCCTTNASVSKETEVDLPDTKESTHKKIISDLPAGYNEPRPCVLVRNVNTGIAIDIRWVVDEELIDAGMEGDEKLDTNFIDQVLNQEFFLPYCIDNDKTLMKKFFIELKRSYGYPEKLIDKDDILYLI